VPIGTLRRAVNYPDPACSRSEEEIAKALKTVGLGHLAGRLDEEGPWDRSLSGGEKQRLAFARIFLQRPDIIVLDEVTTAIDSPSQHRLMELLSRELKEATVLSIGHRPELTAFHEHKLILKPGRRGTKLVSDTATRTEQISSINCEHFFPGAISLLPQEIRCLGRSAASENRVGLIDMRSRPRMRWLSPWRGQQLLFVPFVPAPSVSPAITHGVSHAEWPIKHEYASTKTGKVTCWPPTAVGIEYAPPRATWFSQREKKL
jgi:ABC transporter